MQKLLKSKWFIVFLSVLAVLISCVVLFFTVSEYAHFKRVKENAYSFSDTGQISGRGNHFKIDTQFYSQTDLDNMTSAQKVWHLQMKAEAIEAIKYTNKALGFDESLYTYMFITTEFMGTKSQENENYIATWSNSPDDGLEVKYQIKTSAIFKIGGR